MSRPRRASGSSGGDCLGAKPLPEPGPFHPVSRQAWMGRISRMVGDRVALWRAPTRLRPAGGRRRLAAGGLAPHRQTKARAGGLRAPALWLSKKWLAPLFRGFHSSLAPTARPGSYAGKPLLRKAFCGFAVHAAKSDYNLRGLRPPNPRGFFDRLGQGASGPPALALRALCAPAAPPRGAGAYPSPGSAARASRNSPSSRAMASAEGARLIRARSWAPPRMPRMYQAICLRIST